ncbi:MAG: 4-hydroxythreonine-4-phosphate dehydrogenase PdxA, partial [Vibrio anguillarum]
MTIKRIVVTAGEPAGIGPDLVLALSKEDWAHQLVVCADKSLLAERAKELNID